jgi:hypothetical protein
VVASPVSNIPYILDAELKYIKVTEEKGHEDSSSVQKIYRNICMSLNHAEFEG